MSEGKLCGRPIHRAPTGVDKEPVCLMHSRDPNKDRVEFQREFWAILGGESKHDRPTDVFDFTGFVFPEVDIRGAKFSRNAIFTETTFIQDARFIGAAFTRNASFEGAMFMRNAIFLGGVFTEDVWFRGATFAQNAAFIKTSFLDVADFRGTVFIEPSQVVFHRVNAGQVQGLRARFANCLFEGIRFEDVNWDRSRKRMILQDELDVGTTRGTTHEVVADAYRRMVRNFERNRQYALAEDCFVGEMEMRRLNPRNFLLGRVEKVRAFYEKHGWARWLGKHVSITNFYRILSDYGSSYRRALAVLAGLLMAFALLLPGLGLRMSPDSKVQAVCPAAVPGTPQASVISWWCAAHHPQPLRQLWGTLKAGSLASLEIATYQRAPAMAPANGSARVAAAFETVMIPGQLAIFLLALRRRFRR